LICLGELEFYYVAAFWYSKVSITDPLCKCTFSLINSHPRTFLQVKVHLLLLSCRRYTVRVHLFLLSLSIYPLSSMAKVTAADTPPPSQSTPISRNSCDSCKVCASLAAPTVAPDGGEHAAQKASSPHIRTKISAQASAAEAEPLESGESESASAPGGDAAGSNANIASPATSASVNTIISAIDAGQSNGSGASGMIGPSRYDFGSTTRSLSSSHSGGHQRRCRICFSQVSLEEMRRCNHCEHRICLSCFSAWIKSQVSTSKSDITCPSCDISIPHWVISDHVSPETLRKLEYYRSRREHSRNPHAVWCAEPTCRELLTTVATTERKKKQKNADNNLECAQCETKTCRKCHNVAHEGTRCKKPRMTHYWNVKNAFWKRFHARKCPECHIWIEKDGGCSEMECTNCNMNFCFRCGTSYYRINLAGRSVDGCRCIRVRKNSLRLARAGVFAISFPFLVVALGIGIPAAALLYYASSNDKREVADRVFEEFFKHNIHSQSGSNSFRNHIQHLVDRGHSDGSTSTTNSSDIYYPYGDGSDGNEDGNENSNSESNDTADVDDEAEITAADAEPEEGEEIVEARQMPRVGLRHFLSC